MTKRIVLLNRAKPRDRIFIQEIQFYDQARQFSEYIEEKGYVDRLKEIKQLGLIKVANKYSNSRYQYIALQIYFHKIIQQNQKKSKDSDDRIELPYSYHSPVRIRDFPESTYLNSGENKELVSVGELLQVLCLAYNLGHFCNTFTSSKALILNLRKKETLYENLAYSIGDPRFKKYLDQFIKEENYHRIHLLNSILALESIEDFGEIIRVTIELLYAYIDRDMVPKDSKLHYVFKIFGKVRDVSFLAYDMQIPSIALTLEMTDKSAMLNIFKELLCSNYGKKSTEELFENLKDHLGLNLYNKSEDNIALYGISKCMERKLNILLNKTEVDYFKDIWDNKKSCLNGVYHRKNDFDKKEILKVILKNSDILKDDKLFSDIEKMDNVRVGYYNNFDDTKTHLVSLRSKAKSKDRIAFKVMKSYVNYLYNRTDICKKDSRYLSLVKYFLYYLFGERKVEIIPISDMDSGIYVTRGYKQRTKILEKHLKDYEKSVINCDPDIAHEIEFLLEIFKGDKTNDTTITIPARIVVYEGLKAIAEFDGMIIHINRDNNQVIFPEAKNRRKQLSFARSCLEGKFENLDVNKLKKLSENGKFTPIDYDCYVELTI